MAQMNKKVDATEVYFIKLGRGGRWEEECLRDGILRFGYDEASHKDCEAGNWDAVHQYYLKHRDNNKGTASSDTTQVRIFYTAPASAIFITFHGGRLHWCRAKPGVTLRDGERGRHIRHAVDGWHSESAGATALTTDRLAGNLLMTQGFRGTICRVKARDYLIRKLNDELLPEVVKAEEAEGAIIAAIVEMMLLLTPYDFELLVDLAFSNSGWRRLGIVGRTQKTVDIELLLPTTKERAFVQVKSKTGNVDLKDYITQFEGMQGYDRMFFIWHTGKTCVSRLRRPR